MSLINVEVDEKLATEEHDYYNTKYKIDSYAT
jgi:hypothetical protein